MSLPPVTHDDLLALVDDVLREAPTEAADIAAELSELCAKHRDSRVTERPGEERDWGR